jgi:hypothetical protein
MLSRLVHLTVVDVLSVLTALQRGGAGASSMARAKQSVQDKRVPVEKTG